MLIVPNIRRRVQPEHRFRLASLYSCVMHGRGIPDDITDIARTLDTIRDFTEDDGKQFMYRKFIAPSSGTISFAKALNRSVTGSMNDHIHAAKAMLEDKMVANDINYLLNKTPMSALAGQMAAKTVTPNTCLRI